jgi:2-isopropylmalate synthase
MTSKNRYQLSHCQVLCGDKQVPTATISIEDSLLSTANTISMTGTGPVDAAYKAIVALVQPSNPTELQLLEYTVSSVTAGIDALGEVTVRLQDGSNGRVGIGRSANTDIIVASSQAYLNAINRLVALRGMELPKNPQFSTSIA